MCKTEFDNKRKTGRTKTASADKKVIGGGAERKVPHHAGAGRSVQYQWEHFVKIFYVSSLAATARWWRGRVGAWQCVQVSDQMRGGRCWPGPSVRYCPGPSVLLIVSVRGGQGEAQGTVQVTNRAGNETS